MTTIHRTNTSIPVQQQQPTTTVAQKQVPKTQQSMIPNNDGLETNNPANSGGGATQQSAAPPPNAPPAQSGMQAQVVAEFVSQTARTEQMMSTVAKKHDSRNTANNMKDDD